MSSLLRLLAKLPRVGGAPLRPGGGLADGEHLADVLTYCLAEQQFAFRSRPALKLCRGLGRHRLLLDAGTLFVDRRALSGEALSARARAFDVPLVLMYLPLARRLTDSAEVAYAVATAHTLAAAPTQRALRAWVSDREAARLANAFPERIDLLAGCLEAWDQGHLLEPATACLRALSEEVVKLRREPYLWPSAPALPVGLEALTMHGMPPLALDWLRDRYGWEEGQERLLPLQVIGLARGITGSLLPQNGIIAAPTSAGKTLLAEVRMLARYFKGAGRRKTIILVPTREVGVERYEQLVASFGIGPRKRNPERRMRICYADRDHHGDDHDIGEGRYDLAILVNEKFRFFQHSRRFLGGVGEVVFDELELIGDESRGVGLELALTSALTAHRDMTVLGLTRPAPGLGHLRAALAWEKSAFLLSLDQRPVPIQVGLYASGRVVYRDCNTGRHTVETIDLGYPNPRKTLKGLLKRFVAQTEDEHNAGLRNNLVIASPTKRENLALAYLLERMGHDDAEVRSMLTSNCDTTFVLPRLAGLEPTTRRYALERLLPMGIAVHDADLTVDERQLVTQAFRAEEIAVLFTTQTLAFGVNLPAHAIAFIDWGTQPGGLDTDYPPHYTRLAEIWDTWLGRVGRYGIPSHRAAYAVYLSRGGPGSDEYETMRRLVGAEAPSLVTHLGRSLSYQEAVLYAIRSLHYAHGEYPTWPQLEAFFLATPSARVHRRSVTNAALQALRALGRLEHPRAYQRLFLAVRDLVEEREHDYAPLAPLARDVAGLLPEPMRPALAACMDRAAADIEPLWEMVNDPALAAAIMASNSDDEDTPAGVVRGEDDRFALTRIGQVACAHGVELDTCVQFRRWLLDHEGQPKTWDLTDLLAMAWRSADGLFLGRVRVYGAGRRTIPALFDDYLAARAQKLGAEWLERSVIRQTEIKTVRGKATLLALVAWREGLPLNASDEDDIEQRYALRADGSSLYRHARDYARILRVMADVARSLPEGTFPEERPQSGGICVPYDLEDAAVELQYGMPIDAADVARLGIDGLSRTWTLQLRDAIGRTDLDEDLPLLDRVRMFADDDDFNKAFPTPGLAARVRKGIEDRPREALAESLRTTPERVARFYSHPKVVEAHLVQGKDRYTALRVMHRRVYAVFRRNVVRGEPIVLEKPEDIADWVSRGAVEFLAEIGTVRTDGFLLDRFFADLDPYNDFSLETLKSLAAEIYTRFAGHKWVDPDGAALRWTGGRGFHVVGVFRGDTWRPVDTVKLEIVRLLRSLCNDVTIFLEDQPSIFEPHVVIDLSPIKARGVYRNAYSIHANTGNVCVPVEPGEIGSFDPECATIERVLVSLNGT